MSSSSSSASLSPEEVMQKYAHLITTSPDFLERYFATSRLHHVSSWRTDLAEYVIAKMRSSARQYRASAVHEAERVIFHVDMDCFFASVALRDRPHLQALPVAVCHAHSSSESSAASSSSEIASCNYIAREQGVRNGMFVAAAKALSPSLVCVPYEFDKYDAVSKALYDALLERADFVQAVSCDEALVDVTFALRQRRSPQTQTAQPPVSVSVIPSQGTTRKRFFLSHEAEEEEDDDEAFERQRMRLSHQQHSTTHTQTKTSSYSSPSLSSSSSSASLSLEESARSLAEEMRAAIFSATGCRASVGISHNPLLARIATKRAKPDGVYFLSSAAALPLLANMRIDELPRIGESVAEKCRRELALNTLGDVQRLVIQSSLSSSSSSSSSSHSSHTTANNAITHANQNITRERMQSVVGERTSFLLCEYAQGRDERVLENKERQTVGADINWGVRFATHAQVEVFLLSLSQEVFSRLQALSLNAAHVTLNVKKKTYEGEPSKFLGCGPCLDLSRSLSLTPSQSLSLSADSLAKIVISLFAELHVAASDVRGVGIHLKKLQRQRERETLRNNFFGKQLQKESLGAVIENEKLTDVVIIAGKSEIEEVQLSMNENTYPIETIVLTEEDEHEGKTHIDLAQKRTKTAEQTTIGGLFSQSTALKPTQTTLRSFATVTSSRPPREKGTSAGKTAETGPKGKITAFLRPSSSSSSAPSSSSSSSSFPCSSSSSSSAGAMTHVNSWSLTAEIAAIRRLPRGDSALRDIDIDFLGALPVELQREQLAEIRKHAL